MEVKGKLKGSEIVGAYYFHIKPRPIFAIFGVLILGGVIWALIEQPPFKTTNGTILILCLTYLISYFFIFLPLKSSSAVKNKRIFSDDWRWKFDEYGVSLTAPGVSSQISWDSFINAKENKNYFLLYTGKESYLPIPKRLFNSKEQLEGLSEMINEKLKHPI